MEKLKTDLTLQNPDKYLKPLTLQRRKQTNQIRCIFQAMRQSLEKNPWKDSVRNCIVYSSRNKNETRTFFLCAFYHILGLFPKIVSSKRGKKKMLARAVKARSTVARAANFTQSTQQEIQWTFLASANSTRRLFFWNWKVHRFSKKRKTFVYLGLKQIITVAPWETVTQAREARVVT